MLLKFLSIQVFTILISNASFSQNNIDIYIKDNIGKALPYASVSWGKSIGLVTDSVGHVQIQDKLKIDSIIISAIGFKEVIIPKNDVLKKNKIEINLVKDTITLPEVIVAKYNVEYEYGVADKKKQTSYIKSDICTNLQGALKISNYSAPSQCKSISVFIAKQSSTDIPYRLRLYAIDEKGLPGKDLLQQELIVHSYHANEWNTYNFDTLNIQLPGDGFFAAVEWLCSNLKSKNGLCIGLTNKIEGKSTFYRYGNIGWIQLRYNNEISKDNIMLKVKIASTK